MYKSLPHFVFQRLNTITCIAHLKKEINCSCHFIHFKNLQFIVSFYVRLAAGLMKILEKFLILWMA